MVVRLFCFVVDWDFKKSISVKFLSLGKIGILNLCRGTVVELFHSDAFDRCTQHGGRCVNRSDGRGLKVHFQRNSAGL